MLISFGRKNVKFQGEKTAGEMRQGERVVGRKGRMGGSAGHRREGGGERKLKEKRIGWWEKREKVLTDASTSPTHAQFLCWWLSIRYEVTS